MEPGILIISGDEQVRDAVPWFAAASGLETEIVDLGTQGVERLQYGALPLAVLIDLKLKGVPAQAVLRAVARRYPDMSVMMIGDGVSDAETSALLGLGASSIVSRSALASEMSHILETLAQRPPARPSFRAHRRLPLRLPIDVQTDGGDHPFESHHTRDVSRSGVFIPMATPPAAGIRVKMRLTLPTSDVLELSGEVARQLKTAGNTGIAVHFLDVDESTHERLSTMLGLAPRPQLIDDDSDEDAYEEYATEEDTSAQPEEPRSFSLDDLFADAHELATDAIMPSVVIDDAPLLAGSAEAEANLALGERLLRIGSYALAQIRFQKALSLDPRSSRIQFLCALAGAREAARLKQTAQATELYLQVLALDPDCTEALDATRTVDGERQPSKKKGFLRGLLKRS